MPDNKDPYGKWAEDYDRESRKSQWHGPAILFGLFHPHLRAGDSVLDLGIGTGLGTVPFRQTGLEICGMDTSPAMLEQCGSLRPDFALVKHDLTRTPWPFEASQFNNIISSGVVHFVGELDGIIAEAARVIVPDGFFGFDFHEFSPAESHGYREQSDGVYVCHDSEYDVQLFRHSADYVLGLLNRHGFEVLYDLELLASRTPKRHFRTLVARH